MRSFVSSPCDCVPALEVERKLQRHLTHAIDMHPLARVELPPTRDVREGAHQSTDMAAVGHIELIRASWVLAIAFDVYLLLTPASLSTPCFPSPLGDPARRVPAPQ